MLPPEINPVLGSHPGRDRTPLSCGRQYSWRSDHSVNSVSAKIQNLEKTIRRFGEKEILSEKEAGIATITSGSGGGRIQYDKISVYPLKRGYAVPEVSRSIPRPLPRSSSFFNDRAKSVAHNVDATRVTPTVTFAERACSAPPAPPAPPRFQQFSTR